MPKPKLFDDNDPENVEWKEDTEYAKNYSSWRSKEHANKLRAKYGDIEEEDSEDSSSTDDDDDEKIPEGFDKSFYKALACLKTKDPRIYDGNIRFFKPIDSEDEKEGEEKKDEQNKNDGENKKSSKKSREKKLFLKDYESRMALEKSGDFIDSDDDTEKKNMIERNPTYVQEQQKIKDSFKNVLQDHDDDEEENFLKPKIKTKEEIQKEEDEYAEFLKGQKQDIDKEDVKELKPLRDYWTDPNLDKNEKFLRDYILNNGNLDAESADVDLDYEQKVHDSDEDLSEDERNIDKQEEFEHKYNFRFEEPDQEFIKRYPRTLENTMRKKDTRRSEKRAEVKARKEQEKVQRREELKQLKAMKRKELEEKLEQLKEITGNDDLPFNILDLDEDYDPEKYDKQMRQVFNEEYYAGEEGDIKPEFPEIDEELGLESTWDSYDPATEEIVEDDALYSGAPHCEDPEFNMDAEFDGKKNLEDEILESTKRRKRRRRSKFAEMISKEKPKFDPKVHPSYRKYYDEYYSLDYEDMIGDLPCRFKYREVVPNDYGLSVEEILMADDKELNKWCSLKKALEFKPEDRELLDIKKYKQKASNETLKKKVLKSLYKNPEEEENPAPLETVPQTTKSKKRKKNKKTADQSNVEKDVATSAEVAETPEPPKKKKKNKIKNLNSNEKQVPIEQNSKSPIKNEIKGTQLQSTSTSQDIPVAKNKKQKKSTAESATNSVETPVSKAKKEKNDIPVANNKKQKKSTAESATNSAKTPVSKAKKEKDDTEKSIKKDKKSNSNGAQKSESVIEKKKNKKLKNIDKLLHKIQKGKISKPDKQALKNKNKKGNENKKEQDFENLSKKEKRKLLFKERNAKRIEKAKNTDQMNFLSDERLKAYGLNPKKFKNKLKYGNKK